MYILFLQVRYGLHLTSFITKNKTFYKKSSIWINSVLIYSITSFILQFIIAGDGVLEMEDIGGNKEE